MARMTTMKTTSRAALLLGLGALILAAGCASTPPPPQKAGTDEVADRVVAHLVAGDRSQADAAFRPYADEEPYRDRVYARVYHTANERYAQSDFTGAAGMLRFLSAHYPGAVAVREGLLYALFLERVSTRRPASDKTQREMASLVADLRQREKTPPASVELVATQLDIDANRIEQARVSFSRFRASWSGTPSVLRPYVAEMGRYLASH